MIVVKSFELDGKSYKIVKKDEPEKVSVFILNEKGCRANSIMYSIEGEHLWTINHYKQLDETIEELSKIAENDFKSWNKYVKENGSLASMKEADDALNPFENK